MTPASFLDGAAKLRDFSPSEVAAGLGLELVTTRDTGPWTGHAAPGAGPFSGFELRSPGPGATFGGMLIASFAAPPPADDLAPALAPWPFLHEEPDPIPFGGSEGIMTGARWHQLGPHQLAVCLQYPRPSTATALAVHGARP